MEEGDTGGVVTIAGGRGQEEAGLLGRPLPPEVVLHCLSFLDPFSLAALSLCSRSLWAVGQDEQLWRRLVIRHLRGPAQDELPSLSAMVDDGHRTWKSIYEEKCTAAFRVGLAVVSDRELMMADLSPWRMEGLSTKELTPIPRKKHGGGKSAMRFVRLRLEMVHRRQTHISNLIHQRWFDILYVADGQPVYVPKVESIVMGVSTTAKVSVENDPLAAPHVPLEEVMQLTYGGMSGLRALAHQYMERKKPATPLGRAYRSLQRFFSLISTNDQQIGYATYPQLHQELQKGNVRRLLVAEDLLRYWHTLRTREGQLLLMALDEDCREDGWEDLVEHEAVWLSWAQFKEEINTIRWQYNVKRLDWISGFFDQGTIFAQTFGIAGILKKQNDDRDDGVSVTILPQSKTTLIEPEIQLSSVDRQSGTSPLHQISKVKRRDGQKLSLTQFRDEYNLPAEPLVLTALTMNWPLMGMDLQDIIAKDALVHVVDENDHVEKMSFCDFLNKTTKNGACLSIFEDLHSSTTTLPEVLKQTGWTVPRLFALNYYAMIPLPLSYQYLIVSATGFGTSLHTEPHGASTWLALISGRKRWLILPRDTDLQALPDYHPDMSAHEFFERVYPHLGDQHNVRAWEAVQEAGEIIFVPYGCPHVVITLEASVAISVDLIDDINRPHIAPKLQKLMDPASLPTTS